MPPLTPWVTRLLLANLAAYAVTAAVPRLIPHLLLVPALLLVRPWTAVTYMFLHGGIWHLAFNMIALFFFGPRLEMRLGGAHFLGLYFVSGLVAAGVSLLFTPFARIIGASGAVFGVLLGFARYWPRAQIFIWGVFPIEARWLVAIMTGLALFGGFSGAQSGVAHFAHLGGFFGGFCYLWARDRRTRSGKKRRLAEMLPGGNGSPSRSDVERWKAIDPEGLHEVNREHLEKVREKLDREGAGGLTARERAFLERLATRQEE